MDDISPPISSHRCSPISVEGMYEFAGYSHPPNHS